MVSRPPAQPANRPAANAAQAGPVQTVTAQPAVAQAGPSRQSVAQQSRIPHFSVVSEPPLTNMAMVDYLALVLVPVMVVLVTWLALRLMRCLRPSQSSYFYHSFWKCLRIFFWRRVC